MVHPQGSGTPSTSARTMEDVLDLYAEQPDQKQAGGLLRPESHTQLIGESAPSRSSAAPGRSPNVSAQGSPQL